MASNFNISLPRIPDPSATPSQPYNVFTDAPKDVASASGDVQAKSAGYMDVLNHITTAMQDINQKKLDNVKDTTGKVAAVADTVTQSTQGLKDQATPLFAKIHAIDARQQELDEMNPIKKAVLGIFNPNYDENHLAKLRTHSQAALADVGNEYSMTTNMNNALMDMILKKGSGQESLLNAMAEGQDSMLKLSGEALSTSRQAFGDVIQRIAATKETDAAQQQLAESALTRLTPENINAALGEAKKTGFAVVGGAKIPFGMLQDRSVQLQNQGLELETRQLALQGQRLNLADAAERRLTQHMTDQELQQAVNNGGMFRGQQLGQSNLAEAMQARASKTQSLAMMGTVEAQGSMAMKMLDSYMGVVHQTSAKVSQMFPGGAPKVYQQYLANQAQTINSEAAKINSLHGDAKQLALSQFYQKAQGWMDEMDGKGGIIDKMIGPWAKSEAARNTARSFLTGQPQNTADMVQGTIDIIAGGGLSGMKLQGPEGNAFAAAGAAYKQALDQARAAKMKPEETRQHVTEMVSDAMTKAYTNAHGNDIMTSIPQIAKQMGHPFGAVSTHDFDVARVAGDEAGYAAIGKQLGISAQDAKLMFSNPASPDAAKIYKRFADDGKGGIKPGMDMSNLQGQLAQRQVAEMLRSLDSGASARPGFRPSQALSDLMQSGRFQQLANAHLDNQANKSFGGYLADGIGGGGLRSNIYNMGQAIIGQATQNHVNEQQRTTALMSQYQGDPVKRAAAVLGSIKGIDPAHEQALLHYIDQAARTAPAGMNPWDAITNVIHGGGGKFQDPALEKVRKLAASQWSDATASTDRVMNRLSSPGVIANLPGASQSDY